MSGGTPFIPPAPSPEGSPRAVPLVSQHSGQPPAWAMQHPSYAGQYVNPYMGSPYQAPPQLATPAPFGSYFQPPMALPGSPAGAPGMPLQPNGFPPDYVGFGLASAAMGTPYVPAGSMMGPPPGSPARSHPPTPWQAPGTGYNTFQQPLPGGAPPWAQANHPAAPAAWAAAAQTPGFASMMAQMAQMNMGGMPPPGGPPPGMPPPQAPQQPPQGGRGGSWRDHIAEREGADKISQFAVGPHYGPVLEPFLVPVVKADVNINPLLRANGDSDGDYLRWNMLWASSYCSRSSDPPHRSWSKGRGEPATFPRLTYIRIISMTFPWMITITAGDPSSGVTCGDVIDQIDDFMHAMVKKEEFEGASKQKKKDMTAAYHINRSTAHGVPGGRLGEGIRRLDWLCKETIFGGIDRNDPFVISEYGGLPATFELKCDKRFQMTEQEIQEQEDLERELEREREEEIIERTRSRASSRMSRATSRATSRGQ